MQTGQYITLKTKKVTGNNMRESLSVHIVLWHPSLWLAWCTWLRSFQTFCPVCMTMLNCKDTNNLEGIFVEKHKTADCPKCPWPSRKYSDNCHKSLWGYLFGLKQRLWRRRRDRIIQYRGWSFMSYSNRITGTERHRRCCTIEIFYPKRYHRLSVVIKKLYLHAILNQYIHVDSTMWCSSRKLSILEAQNLEKIMPLWCYRFSGIRSKPTNLVNKIGAQYIDIHISWCLVQLPLYMRCILFRKFWSLEATKMEKIPNLTI